ncbi:MAG: hypothetical protein A2Z11_00760 [Candidatus Woykebacteria bacterium RBG_16_43_9]|uniref:Glycosyl transferase family 1 domain-containing protein n=1 Tax=Candidatus Woykebacteria bacterium RBG_16_43_9 TaxID=1802596 RepID=A0A1G1WCL3_9BACT|nr:MAG: hypothetical protein A2Z11_00760 [Candidatus Woykebacteria bacterium RBG_16_43_9]
MLIGIDASRIATEEKTGTENYSYNLITTLIALDKKNRYVLYFNNIPPFFEINQPNVSTKILRAPRFWTQGRLAWECLLRPPDILFVPAHTIPVVRRPNLKTIVTIHDLGAQFLAEYHKLPQKLYLNWSTKYASIAASHLIAVSKFTKKDLMRTLKVLSNRISVVHEAVNKEHFFPRTKHEIAQTRAKYGLAGRYFTYVGTIQPRKNLLRLIEAFAKANFENIDLVLIGSNGWLNEDIYKAPEKFNVSNHVRFLGYVPDEDLPALYSGAIALTFPSLYEGFGLPILEAFACNCPVLTSNDGATTEVAEKAALLVDPLDTSNIASGMKKLATNNKLREELINKGIERVGDFSWERSAKDTLKVIERVYKQ